MVMARSGDEDRRMTTLYDEQELWALLRAFEERYGMDSAEFFRRW
jgi:hypothetical protein